jgi:hypothetical protein
MDEKNANAAGCMNVWSCDVHERPRQRWFAAEQVKAAIGEASEASGRWCQASSEIFMGKCGDELLVATAHQEPGQSRYIDRLGRMGSIPVGTEMKISRFYSLLQLHHESGVVPRYYAPCTFVTNAFFKDTKLLMHEAATRQLLKKTCHGTYK